MHDLSDGGLAIAAAGDGAGLRRRRRALAAPARAHAHVFLFGEDQGRYLIATAEPDAVIAAAGPPASTSP